MSNHVPTLTKRSAWVIYVWLVVLTLVEVGIVWMGIPRLAGTILMAGTTLGKLMMIGLYFMHVKNDRPVGWLLPVVPLLMAVLFVLGLFPDIVYHLPLRFH